MTHADALFEIDIPTLTRIARGKVRDIFAIDEQHLLIVTTDRLSAYDIVMPDPIPGKGQVLTELSNFWFRMMQDLVPNHLAELSIFDVISDAELAEKLQRRSMLVQRLKPLPIEAVVRGYLIGSGWTDYVETGGICGIELPSGLEQAAQLPETIFTPATKASGGDHDENVSFEQVVAMLGAPLAIQVRDIALKIYARAATFASERGIIIADTKLEFGQDDDGRLFIIDEILTPDSSRFWSASEYRTGISPPSFDKQFVRDYLETLDWDKTAPGPTIPADILQRSGDKYREARKILTS